MTNYLLTYIILGGLVATEGFASRYRHFPLGARLKESMVRALAVSLGVFAAAWASQQLTPLAPYASLITITAALACATHVELSAGSSLALSAVQRKIARQRQQIAACESELNDSREQLVAQVNSELGKAGQEILRLKEQLRLRDSSIAELMRRIETLRGQADPYEVLGCAPGESRDSIYAVYRSLVKIYHPDAHPGEPARAKAMNRINDAWDRISRGDRQ